MLRSLFDALLLLTEIDLSIALVFVLFERVRPSITEQPHWRRGAGVDVGYVYLGGLLAFATTLAGFDRFIDGLAAPGGASWLARAQAPVGAMPFVAQLGVAVVLADFFGYWKHRALHTRWLWPFHAVHHSSEDVDWLSNERMHPVEMVMTSLFQVVPLALLGFPALAIVWAGQIRRLHSIYEHANLRIGYGRGHYLLVSPIFHRWHHSTDASVVDKNFANIFSLFDWLFGTFVLPTTEPPAGGFGVPGFPRDLWGQTVQPVRDVVAMAAGRAPRDAIRD